MKKHRWASCFFFLWVILCFCSLGAHEQVEGLKLGVMCALPKELGALAGEVQEVSTETMGMRTYLTGNLWGRKTMLATSRVGKVAAAATATHMIESGQVDVIVFLGVAGAVDPALAQGDVIVAERLVQHDLDARPLISRFTVPLLNVSEFAADPRLAELAVRAARDFLSDRSGQVHVGLIGTGDTFVSNPEVREALKAALPNLLAVDMEGAAVAQVCYEHKIPFVVIRTISDGCDEHAAVNCMEFLREVAPRYTHEILKRFYAEL